MGPYIAWCSQIIVCQNKTDPWGVFFFYFQMWKIIQFFFLFLCLKDAFVFPKFQYQSCPFSQGRKINGFVFPPTSKRWFAEGFTQVLFPAGTFAFFPLSAKALLPVDIFPFPFDCFLKLCCWVNASETICERTSLRTLQQERIIHRQEKCPGGGNPYGIFKFFIKTNITNRQSYCKQYTC